MNEVLLRSYAPVQELRLSDGANGAVKTMRGYAAVFNSKSQNLGWFREMIMPGAFKNALKQKQDVRALFNHDPNMVLGRSSAGTLRMSEDDNGLLCEIDLPDTTLGRDLAASVSRGDINQMSFAFTLDQTGARWSNDDGDYVRNVLAVKRLVDASVVTYPAYEDTTVGMRSGVLKSGLDLEELFNALYRAEQKNLTEADKTLINSVARSLDAVLGVVETSTEANEQLADFRSRIEALKA